MVIRSVVCGIGNSVYEISSGVYMCVHGSSDVVGISTSVYMYAQSS